MTPRDESMRARSRVVVVALVVLAASCAGPVSAQGTSTDQAIRLTQRQIQRHPQNATAYFKLGDAYIQKARQTGDPSYFTLAESALRRSLELAPQNAGAARHLAYVFSSRHEFVEAAAQAQKAIDLDSADSHAYGVLGDALLELGKYDDAGQAFDTMMRMDKSLYSLARLSGLRSLRGDPEGAIAELRRAIEAGRTTGEPPESIAWAQWQLGVEYFAVGNLQAAEVQYLEALTSYPTYYRALASLAQVRAAQHRSEEAIDLYGRALGVIPFPEYAAGLGDLYTTLGRTEEASKQYALVEYIGRLNALNRVVYNRELASFYADHDRKLDDALALARSELEIRHDIYGYDILAWALYKAGKLEEAVAPMTEALRLGTKDAKLYFHAGMIYQSVGQADRAREFLARALSTNPRFHLLHAPLAERILMELETP
jgi:tetratricopeptide (TPR) repeat protein